MSPLAGHPETGKWIYLQETWPTEEEAETARDRLVALVESGKAAEAMESFGAAVRKWLDSREDEVASGELAADTLSHYRNLAENHVIPALGDIAVSSLERELVPAAEQLYRAIGKCRVRCQGRMEIEHYAPGAGNARLVRDLTGHMCGAAANPTPASVPRPRCSRRCTASSPAPAPCSTGGVGHGLRRHVEAHQGSQRKASQPEGPDDR